MSEFAPICIYLVISLLVSLILLGLMVLNSYIQSQTTRKLPLIHAELLGILIPIFFYIIWFGIPGIAYCADGDEKIHPAPRSPSWTRVLFGSSEMETEDTGTSVNQGVARPVPPANPVASGEAEAGPSHLVPFPYDEDEVIGGDSLLSIRKRLLASKAQPSAWQIYLAHLDAQDRFEVKVDIIQHMAGLDPTGDWMGRGARALDNLRTATGEESLMELYRLRDELHEGGVQSDAFKRLKEKISTRVENLDENSTT